MKKTAKTLYWTGVVLVTTCLIFSLILNLIGVNKGITMSAIFSSLALTELTHLCSIALGKYKANLPQLLIGTLSFIILIPLSLFPTFCFEGKIWLLNRWFQLYIDGLDFRFTPILYAASMVGWLIIYLIVIAATANLLNRFEGV